MLVAHMGVTVGGSIGAKASKNLDECIAEIDTIAAAARKVRNDMIILCHGGPISSPQDAEYVLKLTKDCHGFYGASSVERLPTETAITDQTRRFKSIAL